MTLIKKILLAGYIIILSSISFAGATMAAEPIVNEGVLEKMGGQEKAFLSTAGFSPSATIGEIIATIIQTVLGLLGIIFIAFLVYAGFQWMTANGNEEKVTKAKQTIIRAIIGLIIVIAAYSITYFVFSALNNSLGGGVERPG
jgi:amino acid transporter